jgi:hypothetical protein
LAQQIQTAAVPEVPSTPSYRIAGAISDDAVDLRQRRWIELLAHDVGGFVELCRMLRSARC